MAALFVTQWRHNCRRCSDSIAVGEVVIDRRLATDDPTSSTVYHPRCLLDVDPWSTRDALDPQAMLQEWVANPDPDPAQPRWVAVDNARSAVDFADREALLSVARSRLARMNALEHDASARRRRKVAEPAPRAPRNEMSVDRKGRPRVSLILGYVGREHLGDSTLLANFFVDDTITSSLREYALIEAQKNSPVDLPWQPIVGALCVASSYTKITRRAIERFLQWKAMDLPVPALFIVGPPGAQRDQCERALRALLDDAGFVGDEAAVCCASSLDRDGMVALGAALDEAVSLDAPREEALVDERARVLAALEAAFEEQRRDAYAAALALVQKRSRGMSAEMKARAARCAARCLAHEPAQKLALAVIQALPPVKDPAELRAAWIDELRAARSVSKTATAIELELLRAKDAGMHRALLALICAEPKAAARSARWIGMLSSSVDRSIAADLKTWAESLSPKDPRRSAAAEVVERIERAAADRSR
jgi:hypothetical protein